MMVKGWYFLADSVPGRASFEFEGRENGRLLFGCHREFYPPAAVWVLELCGVSASRVEEEEDGCGEVSVFVYDAVAKPLCV